jgi:outer membrane protein assembly factor BamB
VRGARGVATWAKRALLAVLLVGAAVMPSRASTQQSHPCHGPRCLAPGSILWTKGLPGSWLAETGVTGTVSSQGPGYAANGGGAAVVGFGTTVAAFQSSTGRALWQTALSGVPAGSQIVGVRAFPGAVAVGVQPPAGQSATRDEVILSPATGQQLRIYPAAAYGGAIAAARGSVVVIGAHAVTAYQTATGRVVWRRSTGPFGEAWRVDGDYVYVTQTRHGYLGSAPVRALLRISVRNGAERRLRARPAFAGTLSGALDGVVLFAGPDGVWAYSEQNGRLLWRRAPAVLELTDAAAGVVYLSVRNTLVGVSAVTGAIVSTAPKSVAGSLYSVSDGIALGLDQGSLGEAWGYDLANRRVVWASTSLPWPHFFVDLSGLGGSASLGSDVVILATCAQVGTAAAASAPPSCLRPDLVAVRA